MQKPIDLTRALWRRIAVLLIMVLPLLALLWPQPEALHAQSGPLTWLPLSSATGELEAPGTSKEQTAALVLDIDRDGVNDFVIASRRSKGPSVVWYRRQADGWQRNIIEAGALRIEAGGAFSDIDHDGDLDIVLGGDAQSNQVWWWENPYPDFSSATGWVRRLVKNDGMGKHHDMLFGDFDGDGAEELVFWNQRAKQLMLAEIPVDPRAIQPWPYTSIFAWDNGREMEGLAKGDIDGDGKVDLVGGGRWFKHEGGTTFRANIIDDSLRFGRAAVGQLKDGGAPEVVLVAGDTSGPLNWYELNGASWTSHTVLDAVDHSHTLDVVDANQDGHLDIFAAEMRLDGGNEDAKLWLLFGDGAGTFTKTVVATGYDNHESRIADLDGDGDLDILGKPYNFGTPRVDIWLNQLSCAATSGEWQRQVVDESRPWRALFIMAADLDGDGRQEIISGNAWYQHPAEAGGAWKRHPFAAPLNNAVAAYDFDNDGDNDILGSAWQDNGANPALAWARNDGNGVFTVLTNIQKGEGDFLQGVAVSRFQPDGPLEVALSWHQRGHGVQMLTVPADPSNDQWSWRMISPAGQNEALSAGDIDRDGDMDLLQGTQWLRNDGPAEDKWTPVTLFATPDAADRSRLADINQDGRLDAVVGYEAISKVGKLAWYEQPDDPAQPWSEHVIAKVIGPMSLDVGDLDGDGDFDVVVGEHNLAKPAEARLLTFTNADGLGGDWQKLVVATGDEHHDGAQLARLDGGAPSILSIGWSHNRTLLYSIHGQCTAPGDPPPANTPEPPAATPTNTPPPPTATVLATPGTEPGLCVAGNGNLLLNPSFEEGASGWKFYTDQEAQFLVTGPGYDCDLAARIEIIQPGTNVQLYQHGFLLEPNTPYRLTFAAYSSTGQDMLLNVHSHSGKTNYGLSNLAVALTTDWQSYSIDFITSGFNKPTTDTRLRFWFAPYDVPQEIFWIDAVRLEKLPGASASSAPSADVAEHEELVQQGSLRGQVFIGASRAATPITFSLALSDVRQAGVLHHLVVTTDSSGLYSVEQIPAGDYLLSVSSSPGYLAPAALEIGISPNQVTEAMLVFTPFVPTHQLFLPMIKTRQG